MIAATEPDFEFHTPRGMTIRGRDALRACFGASTSASRTGFTARPPWLRARRGALPRVSSASVFQAPQPGHCPCHLADSAPQAEQMKTDVGLGMVHRDPRSGGGRFAPGGGG